MTIHILQVLSGECIIVDFENGKCILVDGGYKRTYPKLKKKLIELNRDGKRLEYVILTHYDEDHIAGLIKFFKENGKKGKEKIIPVDNVICNQFTYLYDKIPFVEGGFRCEISYNQQQKFEEVCQNNGWVLSQNDVISDAEFKGTDYTIKVISPSAEALKACREIEIEHEQAGNRIQPIGGVIYRDLSDWCKISKGSELSIVNKASLSFEIIYGECRLLFCGDADMNRYKERLLHHYDVIKLSHHGTYIGNECFCNSSQVIADNYIISTNGQRKEHPNRRLLAEVLMQPHCKKLLLNYDLSKIKNEQYYLLYDEKQQAKYAFNTITTQSIAFGEKHNDGN